MGIIGYVRWRLSSRGRTAYKTYARGRRAIDQVTRAPRSARAPRTFIGRAAERRRVEARRLAALPAARERARQQTRAATAMTGGDWPDGRWERTHWENGRPVRTYRGTRTR